MRKKVDFETLSCKFFANSSSTNLYLTDIRKYKKMTPEEEEALFTRIKNGDKQARQELFLRNQRFIYSLAKRYAKTEDEVMDYVGEGNIGLNEAIDKYEPNKGFKFMTYAVWYIRRAMNYYLTDTKNMVNRTNNLKIAKKIDRFKQKFYNEHGRYPDEAEIMEHLKKNHNINIKDISDVYDVTMASINEAQSEDDDFTIEKEAVFTEKTSTDNTYERAMESEFAKEVIKKMLKQLSLSEMRLIVKRFGLDGHGEMSLDDIADEMGVSVATANKMVEKTLARMKLFAVRETVAI